MTTMRDKKARFDGYQITVTVQPSGRITGEQKRHIKAGIEADLAQGKRAVQGNCAIAEAVGEALGARYLDRGRHERQMITSVVEIEGIGAFELNQASRPRFGADEKLDLFITVNLLEQDAKNDHDKTRWRFTWKNQAIPRVLAERANAHDNGEVYAAVTVVLKMDDAEITWATYKEDPRPKGREANERKNNAGKSRVLVEVTQAPGTGVVTTRVRDRGVEADASKARRAARSSRPATSATGEHKAAKRNNPQTSTVTRKHRRPSCVDLDAIYR